MLHVDAHTWMTMPMWLRLLDTVGVLSNITMMVFVRRIWFLVLYCFYFLVMRQMIDDIC